MSILTFVNESSQFIEVTERTKLINPNFPPNINASQAGQIGHNPFSFGFPVCGVPTPMGGETERNGA